MGASANWTRTRAMKKIVELCGGRDVLNFKALRLGDSPKNGGDGRPAVGSSNPITQRALQDLCEKSTANGWTAVQTLQELDAHIRSVTDGKWTAADYARVTATPPGKSGPARPSVVHPVPVPVPAPVVTETEEEEDGKLASALEEIDRLKKALAASGAAPVAAHPLEDIAVPFEKVRKMWETCSPTKAMVNLAETIERIQDPSIGAPASTALSNAWEACGPAGAGKSLLAAYVVHELTRRTGRQWALVKVDCSSVPDTESGFFMVQGASAGSTTDHETPYARAIETADTIVLLDEINRAPLQATNILLGVYDGYASVKFTDSSGKHRTYNRNPLCFSLMTRNEGREYAGAGDFDRALQNRCSIVNMAFPEPGEMATILAKGGKVTPLIKDLCSVYKVLMASHSGRSGPAPLAKVPADAFSARVLSRVVDLVRSGVPEDSALGQSLFQTFARYRVTGQECPGQFVANLMSRTWETC